MKTLFAFTLESKDRRQDLHVEAGVECTYIAWKYGRCRSGIHIHCYISSLDMNFDVDSSFFISTDTISDLAEQVSTHQLDIVQGTLEIDRLIKTRFNSLVYGI